jgi:hypothetical protein
VPSPPPREAALRRFRRVRVIAMAVKVGALAAFLAILVLWLGAH